MLQSLFLLASLLADASLAADIFTSRAFAEVMPGSVPKQVQLATVPVIGEPSEPTLWPGRLSCTINRNKRLALKR